MKKLIAQIIIGITITCVAVIVIAVVCLIVYHIPVLFFSGIGLILIFTAICWAADELGI